mmetsp:Transcript_92309/g.264565  ORF Transcript_92309/g.264565 Transcript_92309/m.264565 type:complete len:250 (+) Transcript_92309:34-783(+)
MTTIVVFSLTIVGNKTSVPQGCENAGFNIASPPPSTCASRGRAGMVPCMPALRREQRKSWTAEGAWISLKFCAFHSESAASSLRTCTRAIKSPRTCRTSPTSACSAAARACRPSAARPSKVARARMTSPRPSRTAAAVPMAEAASSERASWMAASTSLRAPSTLATTSLVPSNVSSTLFIMALAAAASGLQFARAFMTEAWSAFVASWPARPCRLSTALPTSAASAAAASGWRPAMAVKTSAWSVFEGS